MIAINGTLVLQLIHFFIAYLIIRFLILKPIITVIFKEKRLRDTLITRIQETKERVTQVEQEKLNALMRYKNYFAAHIPIIGSKKAKMRMPELQPQEINEQQIKEQAAKIVSIITDKGESL